MRKGGRKSTVTHDPTLLEMALVGYESAKEAIDQKISEIKRMIGGSGKAISAAVDVLTSEAPVRKRRVLSAAARKSISNAQKRRWNEARKAAKTTVKKVKATAKKTVKNAKAAVDKVKSEVPF